MSTAERTLANPFYAVVGAGDLAIAQVTDVVAQLRERTETATETASTRFEETKSRLNSLPDEVPSIDELRAKLNPEELRKVAEPYVELPPPSTTRSPSAARRPSSACVSSRSSRRV